MRTTITFDDDVASAVRRIQRERGVGISEAVNDLARAGLTAKSAPKRFHQRTADLGLKVDVTNASGRAPASGNLARDTAERDPSSGPGLAVSVGLCPDLNAPAGF